MPIVVPASSPAGGASPAPAIISQRATTGAVGVTVAVGGQNYQIPVVIRVGESAPFEITVPPGFGVSDLRVAPGWKETEVVWKGGQLLDGPTSDPACGTGAGVLGDDVPGLAPGSGQICLALDAQATTTVGTWIRVEAVVATFAPDGTVTEVTEPFILLPGTDPAVASMLVNSPNLRIAWLAPSGAASSTGVWIRWAKQTDVVAN